MQETWVRSLGQEDPLEKGTDTHTSIFAWRILWTEELVDYSPWSSKESDMTERLGTHTHTWFILKKVFSSGSLEILCTLGRGWLFDQSPVEDTATEFAMSFSGKQPFIRIALTHCWRNYACSVGLHGRGLLEVCTLFPTDFDPQAFSLCWSLSANQCNESKSEVWLYAETCKSFQQITKPGRGCLGDPDTYT